MNTMQWKEVINTTQWKKEEDIFTQLLQLVSHKPKFSLVMDDDDEYSAWQKKVIGQLVSSYPDEVETINTILPDWLWAPVHRLWKYYRELPNLEEDKGNIFPGHSVKNTNCYKAVISVFADAHGVRYAVHKKQAEQEHENYMLDLERQVEEAETRKAKAAANLTLCLGLPMDEFIPAGVHCLNITIRGCTYNPGYVLVEEDKDDPTVTHLTRVGLQRHLMYRV